MNYLIDCFQINLKRIKMYY